MMYIKSTIVYTENFVKNVDLMLCLYYNKKKQNEMKC